jgi:hypothetical protein
MLRIGQDRIGVPPVDDKAANRRAERSTELSGLCPVDGERGVFRRTALVCPRCGRVLGGF